MGAIKNALNESAYQDTAGRKDYNIKQNDLPTGIADAAHWWFEFGFNVIPVLPNTKKTPVLWQPWLDGLSHKAIDDHWNKNPSHELGFIADDKVIVLDADSPASLAGLRHIEKTYDKKPNLIVKTKKGEHHFAKRSKDTFAKQCGYSSDKYPENIDVKTGRSLTEGRALIVLPPSTDKVVVINEADSIDDLVEIDQDFIDAVFSHNGEEVPRLKPESEMISLQSSADDSEAAEILSYVKPDLPYHDWVKVIAGVKEHFNGSELGLMILNRWSKPEQHDCTFEILEYKYHSFKVGKTGGATFASVCDMARKAGADLSAIAKKHREKRLFANAGKPLCQKIESSLQKLLDVDDEVLTDFKIDPVVIGKMIKGSFWSPAKSKLFLLNSEHDLINFVHKDAWKNLCRTFGSVQDSEAIKEVVNAIAESTGLSKADQVKLESFALTVAKTAVIDHIQYYNQRDMVEWRVDMFTKHGRIEVEENFARVVLPHKPFDSEKAVEVVNMNIVEDYKKHFKRFDELINFLVASRFATDRKKAYLWIKAESDWGKGFFTDLLAEMGTTVSLTVKEVESIFEGKPANKDPRDFKRAFALIFNEFKSVKSELKELEKEIGLAPKFQLSTRVQVFAKLLFSAEGVQSLVNENGVEDQFANRMSKFEEKGNLNKRELFIQVGKYEYFNHILTYTIQRFNDEVSRLVSMGRKGSANYADKHLDEFIGKYGLDTLYQRYSDMMPEIADDMIYWIKGFTDFTKPHQPKSIQVKEDWYLTCVANAVDMFINENFDQSTAPSIRKKKDELIRLISHDGDGKIKTYHLKDMKPFKGIKLRDPELF